jgi:uncharacterized membrane-anchored protein YhcB (DUF1043 family)
MFKKIKEGWRGAVLALVIGIATGVVVDSRTAIIAVANIIIDSTATTTAAAN